MFRHDHMAVRHATTIDDLRPGEKGIIVQVLADEGIKQRLMDLGLIEGTEIEMIRHAPFGDPIQIKALNTHIALRRREARMIVIDAAGEEHSESPGRYRHRFSRKSQLW